MPLASIEISDYTKYSVFNTKNIGHSSIGIYHFTCMHCHTKWKHNDTPVTFTQ